MRKRSFLDMYAMVVSTLLRNERECSLPELLILLEMDRRGEMSTLAIEKHLHERGVKNARMVLTRAESMRFVVRSEKCADGRWWRMTEHGAGVLQRAIERVAGRKT